MATLTPAQAIAQLKGLGITLTENSVNELQTASDTDIQQVVNSWLQVVQPPNTKTFLSQVLKIIQQVQPWVAVAAKIAGLFGISA
jgi:hypothetical protein